MVPCPVPRLWRPSRAAPQRSTGEGVLGAGAAFPVGRRPPSGSCLPEGATPRVTRAIQLVLTLSGLFGGGDKDLAWAEENRGTVLAAVAASLGLPPGRLIIEFVMVKRSAGAGRRLLGEGRRAQDPGGGCGYRY